MAQATKVRPSGWRLTPGTHRLAVLATLCVGALAAPVSARQDQAAGSPSDPPIFSTVIVVTPERGSTDRASTTSSTDVVEGTSIPGLPAMTLSEVVTSLPGFSVARGEFYAGRPVVSARGFFGAGEADYVLLLMDGTPVVDAESGLSDWSVVGLSPIRRVEFVRGPAAAAYGDAAIGGVIQVLTEGARAGQRITMMGGSYGTVVADGSLFRRGAGIGAELTGAARTTAGFYGHSDARQFVGTGGLDGHIRPLAWRWTISGASDNREDPGLISQELAREHQYQSDPMYQRDAAERQKWWTTLAVEHPTAAWHPRGRVTVTRRTESATRTIALAPGLGDTQHRDLSALGVVASGEAERTWRKDRPLQLRAALDVARDDLSSGYRPIDDSATGGGQATISGDRVRLGAVLAGSWQPSVRARLTAALRWDRVADAGFSHAGTAPLQAWSPRVGASIRLSDRGSISAFAQLARAFKAPTLDQRYDVRPYPDFAGGTFIISNPHLLPQRARTLEAGVTGGTNTRWSALAYVMDVEDEIDFDVRTFTYTNIGRSRHRGIELEVSQQAWHHVRPTVAYAWCRVSDRETRMQLKNIPEHSVKASAALDLPWSLESVVQYRSSAGAYLDDNNLFALRGASVFDVRVHRPVGRATVILDVLNVTNRSYDEFGYALPGIDGGFARYVVPGAPRGVRVGAALTF